MTLLNVERIKLFSTRSPYWCLIAIAVAALGFATLFGLVDEGRAAIPYLVLRGTNLGMSIYMVLAALAVTTEYRFGTIKNSFLAVPQAARGAGREDVAAGPDRTRGGDSSRPWRRSSWPRRWPPRRWFRSS